MHLLIYLIISTKQRNLAPKGIAFILAVISTIILSDEFDVTAERFRYLKTQNSESLMEKKNGSNMQTNEKTWERIIFIKTHKTGSSTIQNIFYRYAAGTLIIS